MSGPLDLLMADIFSVLLPECSTPHQDVLTSDLVPSLSPVYFRPRTVECVVALDV